MIGEKREEMWDMLWGEARRNRYGYSQDRQGLLASSIPCP